MSLKFFDGFDAYATAQLLLRWTASGSASIGASGRNGGNALQIDDTNGFIRKNFGGTASDLYFGFAIKFGSLNRIMPSFMEGTTVHIDLRTTAGGALQVTRAGTVLATSTALFATGLFYYLQVHIVVHDTTGSVEVLRNGVQIINVTGVDTRNGGTGIIDTIGFGNQGLGATDAALRVDDLWVCDTSGAINNGYLGDVRAQVLLPSGAGAHTDWTPSAGSNYQNVDDASPNGDTDYNSSATAAQKDTFAYGDLTPTSGTIAGVQHLTYSRKDDAGARTARPMSRISATDYPGATFSVLDTYAYDAQIEEVSPASGVAWTIAEVNAAEFGYELVS